MSAHLPEPLNEVVELFSRLPGLGRKSALRIAMRLLEWPESDTKRLGANITALRDDLALCPSCGGISSNGNLCEICQDATRSKSLMCIVAEWDGMLALEAGGFYNGQYYVLGGLPRPGARDIFLDKERFLKRMADREIREVILALGSTIDAENAATFIRDMLRQHYPHIVTSRLAQGMPLGAEVKHMDQETLRQSMQHRQTL